MNATELHLLLNHFPILGTLFGLCLLIFGLLRHNRSLEKAAYVTLVVISLIAIPAFKTGEEAEEKVEHLPGVSHAMVHEHEEWAEKAIWLMALTGILSLVSLLRTGKVLRSLTFISATATLALMVITGSHGGKIMHHELTNTPAVEEPHEYDDD
ncbi:MAG TPA: hypothetical protein DCG19_00630 [Cryomorphaceae bacterium]|nr:hypothetical protein [Owenweeksia sp.]HAD95873.1 hypothetical protein [Cryomorphaceae bacterium]HBF21313.1 hypothetical protein [Cryomorphaceae bacterium]HCQ15966.1 hypothetical protein [Cryomorphaceae bacterium]|tara:strand:- start:196 stop:657 length:462 start_codon:yes stop_codon:yes gene_type:complete